MAEITIATARGEARAVLTRVPRAHGALLLGHGAGGGIQAADLLAVTEVATAEGFAVARVLQPYRVAGRRSTPPAAHLDAAWLDVVARLGARELSGLPLIFGGRSSGARVACRTAAPGGAIGVLCLAFPLQPPRRRADGTLAPDRAPELDGTGVPTLVVQGRRDPFGMPAAAPDREVVAVPGDHSLRAGLTELRAAVPAWLGQLPL
ncbi:MAG TPA: alpha/beta family hydrolase [Solirubrobacteraceae bacterium]|nr:alpha/beta family hydrolase [Solirubrobacteraceae bacterium]